MATKNSESFPSILPKHPHRRLYILLSILIFVLVAGGIVTFQIQKVEEVPEIIIPIKKTVELTESKRNEIITNLNELAAKSPPLTEAQRAKIVANLKKTADNQNK